VVNPLRLNLTNLVFVSSGVILSNRICCRGTVHKNVAHKHRCAYVWSLLMSIIHLLGLSLQSIVDVTINSSFLFILEDLHFGKPVRQQRCSSHIFVNA